MIVNEEESKETTSNVTLNEEVKLRQKNLELRSMEQ